MSLKVFKMIYFVIIVFLSLKVIQGEDQTCTDAIKECGLDIRRLYIPYNELELQKVCRRFRSYFACFDELDAQEERDEPCGNALVLQKSRKMINRLCFKGSDLHSEYLKHASCLGRFQLELDKYWERSEKYADLYYRTSENPELAKSLKKCITGCQFLLQLSNAVMRKCKAAVPTVGQIMGQTEFQYFYCNSKEEFLKADNEISNMNTAMFKRKIKPKYKHTEQKLAPNYYEEDERAAYMFA